jgi:hypothetical protein
MYPTITGYYEIFPTSITTGIHEIASNMTRGDMFRIATGGSRRSKKLKFSLIPAIQMVHSLTSKRNH